MKARIVTKISERVLLFAIDNTVKAKLEVILQQLDIQSHTVFPPPVGTVSVKRPGPYCAPADMHCSKITHRCMFRAPFGGNQPET